MNNINETDIIHAMMKQYFADNQYNQTFQEFRKELKANQISTQIENLGHLKHELQIENQQKNVIQELLYQFARKQNEIEQKSKQLEILKSQYDNLK